MHKENEERQCATKTASIIPFSGTCAVDVAPACTPGDGGNSGVVSDELAPSATSEAIQDMSAMAQVGNRYHLESQTFTLHSVTLGGCGSGCYEINGTGRRSQLRDSTQGSMNLMHQGNHDECDTETTSCEHPVEAERATPHGGTQPCHGS